MAKVIETRVETQRRFSKRGPRYAYEGTFTTKKEADSAEMKFKKRGFRVVIRKAKIGTRVYREIP